MIIDRDYVYYKLITFFLIQLDYGGTRVAAVSFSNNAEVEFNYDDDVNTTEKVFNKLDAMEVRETISKTIQ